jgi:WhiB family redox-sensing transcriptional regulator
MPVKSWVSDAACARVDGDAWFPEVGESNARAKQICNTCPVKEPCLQWALDNNEQYGVFGGTSRQDRQEINRRKLKAA